MKRERLDSPLVATGLFVILLLTLGLPGLGRASLYRMEGMVAAISGEMLRSGDFAVSRLYGELYTYKPPFLYWMVAAARAVAESSSEWILRLPVVLSVLAMGLAVVLYVGRIAPCSTALVAASAAVVNALFAQNLRIASFDAPLAAFVGVAIVSACIRLSDDSTQGELRDWLLCYAALAAGVLTKGTPALMVFVPGLLLAALVTRRIRVLLRPAHMAGVLLLGLAIAGYLIAAFEVGGAEVFRQPLEEARGRGAEWTLGAAGRTLLKPLVVWALFLPWSAALFWSGSPVGQRGSRIEQLRGAAAGFLFGGLLAFIAVPTHEPRYFLPLAVPLGILVALSLPRMEAAASLPARALPVGLGLAFGAAAAAMGLLPVSPATTTSSRAVLVGVGVATVTAALALARRRPRTLRACLLLAALSLWSAENLALGPHRATKRDQRPAAMKLLPNIPADSTLWTLSPAGLVGSYSGLLHYLDRPVKTFTGEAGPPEGELCLLREQELAQLSAAQRRRLELVATVEGPRWVYSLYRAGPPGG